MPQGAAVAHPQHRVRVWGGGCWELRGGPAELGEELQE